MKSSTAPSGADPVVDFPLCQWCPPQETSQPTHPGSFYREHTTYLIRGMYRNWHNTRIKQIDIFTCLLMATVAAVCKQRTQGKSLETQSCGQAPVPLTIFRSNSKFDQHLQCSGLKYPPPITTKFSTRHDSYTVVTCAKFHCDWLKFSKLEHSKFWSNFKFDRNTVSGTGAWQIVASDCDHDACATFMRINVNLLQHHSHLN